MGIPIFALTLALLPGGCDPGPTPLPPPNAYVGKTEAVVRGVLGQPDHEFAGHFGLPDANWAQKFTGEIKTAVFRRGGDEVYVTYEKRLGTWIVISDQEVPKGATF